MLFVSGLPRFLGGGPRRSSGPNWTHPHPEASERDQPWWILLIRIRNRQRYICWREGSPQGHRCGRACSTGRGPVLISQRGRWQHPADIQRRRKWIPARRSSPAYPSPDPRGHPARPRLSCHRTAPAWKLNSCLNYRLSTIQCNIITQYSLILQ